MKLVVVGGGPEQSGQVSRLLTRLEKTGIAQRMIIYTPSWKTSLDILPLHQDIDAVFIPADAPVDYLKQLKRSEIPRPLIVEDYRTGDFKFMNLRIAKGTVSFDSAGPEHAGQKLSQFLAALNLDNRQGILYGEPLFRSQSSPPTRERFLVKIASKLRPISIDEIAYFYADNRLNFLTTWEGQRFIINHSMEELVRQVSSALFFRISRSFIVSYKSIDMIQVQDRNRLRLILTPGFKNDVFVSRDKVTEFKDWVGE